MSMTGAQERERAEKDARVAQMPPVVRRMNALREQMAQLDRVLGELRDTLEPVLLQGPPPAPTATLEQVVNTSSMGEDLDALATSLESVVDRVRELTSQVDL